MIGIADPQLNNYKSLVESGSLSGMNDPTIVL